MDIPKWPHTMNRADAIRLIDQATDRDDPYWENMLVVSDLYDDATDTMPLIYDVMAALGVSEAEYKAATGAQNINWPQGYQ